MKVQNYQFCKRCPLWKTRRNIVFGRGSVPADILFIGEAPTGTDDATGQPLSGTSGRLFNQLWSDAVKMAGVEPTYYITNVLACRPCDAKGAPNRTPTHHEIGQCYERLAEEIKAVNPSRVVFLGKVAGVNAKKLAPGGHTLISPGAIARLGGVSAPIFRATVRDIAEIIKSV